MGSKWHTVLRSFAVAVALLWSVSPSASVDLPTYSGIAANVFFRCDGVVRGAFFPAGASLDGSAGGLHLGYVPPGDDHAYAYGFTRGVLRPDGIVPIAGQWTTSVFLYFIEIGEYRVPVHAVVNPTESQLEGSLSSRAGGVLFLHGTGVMQHIPTKDQPVICTVNWTFEGQQRSNTPPQAPSGLWVTTQGVDVKARGPAGRGALWRAITPCAVGTTCFAPQGSTSPDLLVRLLPLGGGRVGPAWMPLSASSFDVWSRQGGGEPRAWLIPTAPTITARPGLLDLIGHAAAAPSTAGAAIDDEREITGAANPPPPSPTWQTTPALPGFRFQALLAGKPLVKTRSCPAKAICLAARPLAAPDVVLRVTAKQANGKRWASLGKFATSTAAVWIEQTSTHALRYYELEQRAADSPLLPGLLDRLAFAP
jgi:hypothetical protein